MVAAGVIPEIFPMTRPSPPRQQAQSPRTPYSNRRNLVCREFRLHRGEAGLWRDGVVVCGKLALDVRHKRAGTAKAEAKQRRTGYSDCSW